MTATKGFQPIRDATLTGFLSRGWAGWTLTVEQASENLGGLGRFLSLLHGVIKVEDARGIRKHGQKRVIITGTLTGKPYGAAEPDVYELTLVPQKFRKPRKPRTPRQKGKQP